MKAIRIVAASAGAGFFACTGFRVGEALTGDRKSSRRNLRQALENRVVENAKMTEEAQTAFEARFSRVEREVASHSPGLSELRECSLRTEHSMQKLPLSIDRLITHKRGVAPPDRDDRYPAAPDAIS